MHRLALATILMVLCGLGVREANSRPLGRRREGPPVVAPARDPDTAARVRYRFNGTGTYHQLGAAAPAGDIDRDGVMDLLLGAGSANGDTGYVRVISGASGNLIFPAYTGGQAAAGYGSSVAGVGDVNLDGYPDFLVSAPGWDSNGLSNNGRVFLYSGLTGAQIRTHDGLADNDRFGASITGVGNINGVAGADYLVGAPATGANRQGGIWLYAANGTIIEGGRSGSTNAAFGFSVSGGADLNEDGIADFDVDGDGGPDFLVGAPFEDPDGRTDAGALHVYIDAFTGFNESRHSYGSATNAHLGGKVAIAGNLNETPGSEFLVLEAGPSGGSSIVHLWDLTFGEVRGPYAGLQSVGFGNALAGIDDATGDAVDDFLIGAYGTGGTGEVLLVSGATGISTPLPLPEFVANFGQVVASLGDLDDDGRAEFLAGAPGASPNGIDNAGSVFVFSAANRAPVAVGESFTLNEDQTLSVSVASGLLVNDTDADGNPLTATLVSQAAHGTATIQPNGAFTYTPVANYNGMDTFTYRAGDGLLGATADVTLTINPVNDPPLAQAQSVTTLEDTNRAITLVGTDVDGDSLTYTVLIQPTRGSFQGSAPNLTYVPNANTNGSDSFTFRVNDGTVNSTTATVSITITPVNDLPVASLQSVTTNEDTSAATTLIANDADGDALTYQVVSGPTNGILAGSGANRTYTPSANYYGSDSFTFRANDGAGNSNTAVVTLTVTPVNDAPTANAQSVTTALNAVVGITLTGSDVEGSPLTYAVVGNPQHGTLTGSGANRTFTPAQNYSGPDSFTFKVNDGQLDSSTATVSITITPNVAPVATAQSVTTAEDTPLNLTLQGTDPDSGPSALSYVIVTQPAHGILSPGTGSGRTFSPAADYRGPDSFTFKVNDGLADSPAVTVSITITPVNDAPVASPLARIGTEDQNLDLVLPATDVDGDSLTYTIVVGPSHGEILAGTGATRTFRPTLNYYGSDSFTFKASDGQLESGVVTVTLTLAPVNDPPVADAAAGQTVEATGAASSVTLNGAASSDVDGDSLTYRWYRQGTEIATGVTPSVALPLGTHTFTLTVSDPGGLSGSDTVTIIVRDTTAPSLTVPANITTVQTVLGGAVVTYAATAADAVPGVTVSSTPASGSTFPVGITMVTCTATDTSGNTTSRTFTVTVTRPATDPAKVTANGAILVAGKKAAFKLKVQATEGGTPVGTLTFTDPVTRRKFKSTLLTALVIEGARAVVYGTGTMTGVGTVTFRVEVADLSTHPRTDTFSLELSGGLKFGPATLVSGSVKIVQ